MRRRGLQGPAPDLADGHEYRSTWERNVARVLRYRGVDAAYEPKRYLFAGQPWTESYLPDWRLPAAVRVGDRHYDTILLEVKGYYDAKSRRRSRNMQRQYAARGVMVLLFREPLYRQFWNERWGRVTTQLEFNRNWGWGSSSSLIDLIAQWTGLDPMELHFETSEGSGFDVACARAGGAIAYQKTGPRSAIWNSVASAHWPHEHFGLVYLGGKQDSQREVTKIRREPLASELDAISALSRHLASSKDAEAWSRAIDELEDRTASWLRMERVQNRFPGVRATIKSLGAWGGDFALAVAQDPEDLKYFPLNGHLLLKWSDCVSLPS
jgi:hypothetical protein